MQYAEAPAAKSVVTYVPAASIHNRVTTVDVMRGAVMVLMALDHVREFLSNAPGNPLKARRVLEVFGRVPFFYFLVHLVVIHLLALLIAAASGAEWRWWVTELPNGGVLTGRPAGWGFGLPVIWALWIVVVALCYPRCTWYAGVKARSRNPLLSYF